MGTIVYPAEHQIFEVMGASQVVSEKEATNETTLVYTVPADKIGYWTDMLVTIKSVSKSFELVKIAWDDDSESAVIDWNIHVSPYDTFTIQINFKRGLRMDESDTLSIISPDANVQVYATATILEDTA